MLEEGRGGRRAPRARHAVFRLPAEKHEAPRSESHAAVFGTSDATRRRDASLIRPSDAFESPDRIATGVSLPQRDRRDSARSSTPEVDLEAHERPANPYAPSWPWWLTEHAGDALAEMRPRVVSSYLKIRRVGQGTYGAVYRGYDLERRRDVALKKIKLQKMDDDTLRFICREIIALRSLKHPNVVELLDVVVADAPETAGKEDKASCVVYLSFEFVEHDLAGLLSATRRRGDAARADETRGASTLLRARALSRAWGVAPRRQGE